MKLKIGEVCRLGDLPSGAQYHCPPDSDFPTFLLHRCSMSDVDKQVRLLSLPEVQPVLCAAEQVIAKADAELRAAMMWAGKMPADANDLEHSVQGIVEKLKQDNEEHTKALKRVSDTWMAEREARDAKVKALDEELKQANIDYVVAADTIQHLRKRVAEMEAALKNHPPPSVTTNAEGLHEGNYDLKRMDDVVSWHFVERAEALDDSGHMRMVRLLSNPTPPKKSICRYCGHSPKRTFEGGCADCGEPHK